MQTLSFMVVLCLALIPPSHLLAQGAEIRVLSPMPGEKVIGNTVAVYVETPGLTMTPSAIIVDEAGQHPDVNRPGQGHLRLILDSESPTTDGPMRISVQYVIWDRTEPYVFTGVPPGDHLLTIQLLQNDHESFDPPLVERIQFTSAAAPAPSLQNPLTLPNTGFQSPRLLFLLISSAFFLTLGVRMRRRAASKLGFDGE